MGKNQAHKQQQRARSSGGATDPEGADTGPNDGMMDGSFHSPAWHAARLAALQTTTRMTWEEFKQKQDDDKRRAEQEAKSEEQQTREFRAQLDEERNRRLGRGTNHSELRAEKRKRSKKDKKTKKDKKSKKDKKDKKDKKHKRKKAKKAKKDGSDDSDSDSDSSDSGSDAAPAPEGEMRLSSFFHGPPSDDD